VNRIGVGRAPDPDQPSRLQEIEDVEEVETQNAFRKGAGRFEVGVKNRGVIAADQLPDLLWRIGEPGIGERELEVAQELPVPLAEALRG
jgi:hypothetical protein